MGHFHSRNLDTLLLKNIYAKGSASINDVVALAEKRKEVLSASEGSYDEKYMIQMGFETLFSIHYSEHHIEPVLHNRKEGDAFRLWKNNKLIDSFGDDGESIGDLAVLDSIKFKFVRGQRKNYKDLIISEVES